jgi:hypothetical protein
VIEISFASGYPLVRKANQMKTIVVKFFATILCTAAFAAFSISSQAQTQTNKPAPDKKSSSSKSSESKQRAGPFHGKLAALDKAAKTVTVGKRNFHVTAETKIIKNDKPATLNDGVVDEVVSGYFKTSSEGKLTLTTLRFGPKTEAKNSDKKTKKS